jgi:hypothetical protein
MVSRAISWILRVVSMSGEGGAAGFAGARRGGLQEVEGVAGKRCLASLVCEALQRLLSESNHTPRLPAGTTQSNSKPFKNACVWLHTFSHAGVGNDRKPLRNVFSWSRTAMHCISRPRTVDLSASANFGIRPHEHDCQSQHLATRQVQGKRRARRKQSI